MGIKAPPPTVHWDLSELYLQHLLVFSCKEGDRAEDQLEQLEVQVGELHVGAHFRQAVEEVLHQNCSKQSRGSRVRQEGIGNNLSKTRHTCDKNNPLPQEAWAQSNELSKSTKSNLWSDSPRNYLFTPRGKKLINLQRIKWITSLQNLKSLILTSF